MIEYTEADLKAACLAWGDHHYNSLLVSPVKHKDSSKKFDKWWADGNTPSWWAEINKPVKKIIDLEPLIESGIDCEFWKDDTASHKHISTLKLIFKSSVPSPDYLSSNNCPWVKCRPRMNHKMCWDGSTPIEGFVVKAYFDKTTAGPLITTDKNIHWPHVKAIVFLEVQDGYAYPWEQGE